MCLQHPSPSAIPCLLFRGIFCCFFFMGALVCQGAVLVYPRCGWGNSVWCLVLTCLVCQMTPKQVWSQRLAVLEPSCFLHVMWCGEALYELEVDGVSFDSSWFFISTKCGSSVPAKFLIYGAHSVYFYALVAYLPLHKGSWSSQNS
jgi:hypothetical protein